MAPIKKADKKKKGPSAMKEMGAPDVSIDTRLNKAVWAKGTRNVPHCICARPSRKHNEDEGSPNKVYTLVIYMPDTTFKIYGQ
ncbi:60S ribosomal protein L31-like [Prionailurus viverrinus]|uniref:60S ribosomal protein L31-like n=1 Tax=Prionailurus viverrinus TaxID=61388 RepID=UPI001FF3BB58|nr:60S ribosomal protein L31-like [Prionailurus viverrinus]